MKNIGILGKGFVGSAVEFGFSAQTGCDWAKMRIHDNYSIGLIINSSNTLSLRL